MCDRADGIYCGKTPFELTKEIRFEKDGDGMGPLPATGNATVMFQRDGKREREGGGYCSHAYFCASPGEERNSDADA